MANTYKNIVITPNITTAPNVVPQIQFSGGDATTNTDINLKVYTTQSGTLSFEGSAGQLFSITNDLTNSIFSVNDVSGLPSIDVNANGLISLSPYGGNISIDNGIVFIDTSGNQMTVNGSLFVLGTNVSAALAASADTFARVTANAAFDKANSANLLAFNTGVGTNAFTSSTIAGANSAVGTGANAFASATIAGANTFFQNTIAGANSAVGTGANSFTSATIAGANSAVGTGANSFASATIAGANSAIGIGANAWSNTIGTTANNWSNSYANSVGTRANAWANSVGTAANSWTNTSITIANNWANSVGTAANSWTNTSITIANVWANSVATAANNWSNSYANSVGTRANAWANSVGTAANLFTSSTVAGANTISIAAFTQANAALSYGFTALSNATGTLNGSLTANSFNVVNGGASIGKTIYGGFKVNTFNIGTITSGGAFTADAANGNYQCFVNSSFGSNMTITAPAADCAIDYLYVNSSAAGSVGLSGFTAGTATGSAQTFATGEKFILSIRRINGTSTYCFYALQ